jgi:hypothetical protein
MFIFGMAKGVMMMTRLSAAAVILICWLAFNPMAAMAQSDKADVPACRSGEVLKDGVCVPDDGKCFPWQEFRNGTCVAKSAAPVVSTPPVVAVPPAIATPPAVATPCSGGSSDASGQCVCPANTRLDAASGNCLATIAPRRKASDNVVCDGGTVKSGSCDCPSGFALMPVNSSVAGSGTCVKTNAENCQGGELTVAGTCFCNGRVTMSGESYALEWLGGKCVPKRCPEHSYLKDGRCVASNDRNFAFTCRTGYIPDEADPGTAATGLHCLPDPTFCDAKEKRRDGSCPRSSAVAIDCFEAKCVCRDPHADWANYLCQCLAPYRNVNGTCVSDAADQAGRRHAEEGAGKPSEPSAEPARRRACGQGMVRSHGECVAAKRRYPAAVIEPGPPGIAGTPGEYYLRRGSRTYRFDVYPIPEREY